MINNITKNYWLFLTKCFRRIQKKRTKINRVFMLSLRCKKWLKSNFVMLSLPAEYSIVTINCNRSIIFYAYSNTYNLILVFNLDALFYYSSKFNTISASFYKQQRFFRLAIISIFRSARCVITSFMRKLRLQGRMTRVYTCNIEDVSGWKPDPKRIYSGRLSLLYRLGFTHLLVTYVYSMRVHFKKKRKFFFYGINFTDLSNKAKEVYNIKPLNIYTHKGIRLKGFISLKRIGKAKRW